MMFEESPRPLRRLGRVPGRDDRIGPADAAVLVADLGDEGLVRVVNLVGEPIRLDQRQLRMVKRDFPDTGHGRSSAGGREWESNPPESVCALSPVLKTGRPTGVRFSSIAYYPDHHRTGQARSR